MIGLIDHRYETRRQTIAMATVTAGAVRETIGSEVVERFDVVLGSDEKSYRRKANE